MKRITALILISSVLISGFATVRAEENIPADTGGYAVLEKAPEAQAFLSAVCSENLFEEMKTEPVTRGEFIKCVINSVGKEDMALSEQIFTDVPVTSEYFRYVNSAVALGLVSRGNNFRPDENIKRDEALKIVVSLLGFSKIAEKNGGYPDGYLKIAMEKDLLKNTLIKEDTITFDSMAVLLYNMFRSEVMNTEYITSDDISYKESNQTLMNELYDISYTEGIITKNRITSYDINYSYSKNTSDFIEVNGSKINGSANSDSFFGMNCIVYYSEKDSDKTVIAVYPKKNNQLSLKLEEIETAENSVVKYIPQGSQKLKKLELEDNYTEVYNGKVTNADITHLTDLTGEVRFVDNDDDGDYDVVFINHYTYMCVKNVDVTDRVIEDRYSKVNNISIDENEVLFSLTDSQGNIMRIADISEGDVLSLLKSSDGTVVRAERITNIIAGTVNSVGTDGKLVINNCEYTLSAYASENCIADFNPGMAVELYIGKNNEIAFAQAAQMPYSYGYAVNVYSEETEENYGVKIFTSGGVFKKYILADKVNYNGSVQNKETVYNSFSTGFEPQLIRYKTNQESMISGIDTAEEVDKASVTLEDFEKDRKEDDKLVHNIFDTQSNVFRSNGYFGTDFNATGALIFLLPVAIGSTDTVDISKTEEFAVSNISKLRSGATYSYYEVYDVDEYGCAKVLLGYNVERNASPYSFSSAMRSNYSYGMISKVRDYVSDEGDVGKQLIVWESGEFCEYFLGEEVEYILPPGEELESGDIVRFSIDGKNITQLILDFNADKLDGNRTYDTRSAPINYGDTIISYQVGKLYNHNGTYCYYTNTVDQNGKYDFSPSNLISSLIKSTYICRYNSKTQTVEPIKHSDLRSQRVYGDEADFIVLKQQSLNTQCVYVFGEGD